MTGLELEYKLARNYDSSLLCVCTILPAIMAGLVYMSGLI